jgi:hypothetical protein
VCISYLFLPLVHHVIGTDGYYNITDSDNFFSRFPALQLGIWLTGAALAYSATRLRTLLAARRAPDDGGPALPAH